MPFAPCPFIQKNRFILNLFFFIYKEGVSG